MTKIKICGLTREVDIEAVNRAKPDYIGFVFAPSKRMIGISQADKLREGLSKEIIPVGVFVNSQIEQILLGVQKGVIEAVQLHGQESEEYIRQLKSLTDVPIIKAVPILSLGDVEKYEATNADYLLLDNKAGGTGKSFDWNNIGTVKKPFFLAGGISIENIDKALKEVAPFAIDISSGVETNGYKDDEKIQTIVRRIRHE